MKTHSTLLAALAAILLMTTSCRKHDDTPAIIYTVPTTYNFTNANFADATTRLGMITEMQNVEKLATTGGVVDGVKLKNMFSNTSSPFVTAAYNTAGIQLKDQCAALFQTDVNGFIDSLVKVNSVTTTASRGIPGVGTSNASTTKYAETGLGVNYAQVFTKGIMGGLITYQEVTIMNNIVSGAYDNTIVVNGSTAREHAWDLAFGYWGVPIDFPANKTGAKLWGSYTTQVDSGYKANKILMTAFCTGRAAISAKDNATAIAQANIIINVFERLHGAAALQEVQEIKASLSDNIVRNSRLSECYGFIYGEKYNPKRVVTDAQINTFLALFPKNFYDLTLTDVNNIRDAVAAQFGFTDVKDIL